MTEIKVLIVEDEPLVADDISDILQGFDYAISGIAHTGEETLWQLKYNTPDVVLLDINLDGKMDGVEVAAHISEHYGLPFIFLTAYADKATLDRAKQTCPMGYIVKPFDEKDIFTSLEIALYNFSNSNKPNQLDVNAVNGKLASPLTKKEFEILLDIYQGKTNQQLAEMHFISINTVKTHVKHLYDKMDVASRTEAIIKLRDLLIEK